MWLELRGPSARRTFGQDGWAHYAEQLVVDEGFGGGDPRYRLAQLSNALTRICRLLSGIRLHTREWSLDDAQACFEQQAYLPAPAARREAERGAYDPTYVGYFLGKLGLLTLRRDYAAAMGSQFPLFDAGLTRTRSRAGERGGTSPRRAAAASQSPAAGGYWLIVNW